MKKEQKQILYIFTFLILGCVIGYFVAVTQMKQVSDPEYIAFWASQDMPVPEPIGFPRSIISFGMLFPGYLRGDIFSHIAKKWLTSAAPKIIIGFLTWPIYTLAGAVGAIPLVVYLIYRLWKGRISCQKCK